MQLKPAAGEAAGARAAGATDAGEELDAGRLFECHICLELAHDPVVTLCGHLYCWPCLYRRAGRGLRAAGVALPPVVGCCRGRARASRGLPLRRFGRPGRDAQRGATPRRRWLQVPGDAKECPVCKAGVDEVKARAPPVWPCGPARREPAGGRAADAPRPARGRWFRCTAAAAPGATRGCTRWRGWTRSRRGQQRSARHRRAPHCPAPHFLAGAAATR